LYKWPLLILFFRRKNIIIYTLHSILFVCLFIPNLLYSSNFILWDFLQIPLLTYPVTYHRNPYIYDILTDNFYIINTLNLTQLGGSVNPTKSFYWFSNNPMSQYFIMGSSSSLTLQSIITHTFQYPFKLTVVDLIPFIIDTLIFYLLIIFYGYLIHKKLIRF
jgi:hypothetical protein